MQTYDFLQNILVFFTAGIGYWFYTECLIFIKYVALYHTLLDIQKGSLKVHFQYKE